MDATTARVFANKMDEEDIDSWYDEEKEKLLEEYMKTLDGKKEKKEAEKKYKERMKKIREKYEMLYEKSKNPGFVKKCLVKIKAFIDNLAEKFGR